jgi:glycosyltransferase involved in cell wall biosynthesis
LNGWTDRDLTGKVPTHEGSERYLYYAGSIYRHRIAALALVLEAMATHPDIRLRIRLLADFSGGSLTELIDQCPISNRIEILPPVDEATVHSELAGSSGVLVLEEISGSKALSNGTITGKLFGLLASGVPGIAVSSKSGEIRSIIDSIPGWHGADSVEEMSAALSEVLDNREIVASSEDLKCFHMAAQARILIRLIECLYPH